MFPFFVNTFLLIVVFLIPFFLYTFRYAAIGDADGEPISREAEFGKMERLEKEVLDYPGLVFFFFFGFKNLFINLKKTFLT